MGPRSQATFLAGVACLIAATVVLATGNWFLECHDQAGTRLGGIDCFQFGTLPRSDSAPADWLGFSGWMAIWLVGAAIVGAIVATELRRRPRATKATSA